MREQATICICMLQAIHEMFLPPLSLSFWAITMANACPGMGQSQLLSVGLLLLLLLLLRLSHKHLCNKVLTRAGIVFESISCILINIGAHLMKWRVRSAHTHAHTHSQSACGLCCGCSSAAASTPGHIYFLIAFRCSVLTALHSGPNEYVCVCCRCVLQVCVAGVCVLLSMSALSGHTALPLAQHTLSVTRCHLPVRRLHCSTCIHMSLSLFPLSFSLYHSHFALMSSSHSSSSRGEMQLSCAIKVSQCQRNLASTSSLRRCGI